MNPTNSILSTMAAIPPILYKYRRFSPRTVEQLCRDQVHYADPATFNDPLDTKPCVEADCDVPVLRQAVFELVRRRVEAQMKAGARAVKYRGPKTVAHIDRHSRNAAQRALDTLEYDATNPEYDDEPPGPVKWLLGHEMERELLRQYDRGVLSLAKRFNCPLMWSHYGDQHRGICLGYRVPQAERPSLHRVDYGGERTVLASSVAAMLKGDEKAREAVDRAVLLKKARDWQYEKEWRLLGPRGDADSPLELIEVLFGMRCEGAVKHAIAKALAGRDKEVRLYEVYAMRGTFRLARRRLDVEELSVYYPRRALSVAETFDAIDDQAK